MADLVHNYRELPCFPFLGPGRVMVASKFPCHSACLLLFLSESRLLSTYGPSVLRRSRQTSSHRRGIRTQRHSWPAIVSSCAKKQWLARIPVQRMMLCISNEDEEWVVFPIPRRGRVATPRCTEDKNDDRPPPNGSRRSTFRFRMSGEHS